MASYVFLDGNRVMAKVRIKPYPAKTKTFDLPPGFKRRKTKKGEYVPPEVTAWAEALERDLRGGDVAIPTKDGVGGMLLTDAAERFIKERHAVKPLGRTHLTCLRAIARHFPDKTLGTFTGADLLKWVSERECAGVTKGGYVVYITSLYRHASQLWNYGGKCPAEGIAAKLTAAGHHLASDHRARRPTEDELARLKAFPVDMRSKVPMADLIGFAVATAMRLGEFTKSPYFGGKKMSGIRWADYDPQGRTVLVRDRKHPKKKIGNHQRVPLLPEAIEIIERQPRTTEWIFPYSAPQVSNLFIRMCRRLNIRDLKFHDLRHEGTSRLFESGFTIAEVAMFTGHTNWNMLRRYTQLKPERVAARGAKADDTMKKLLSRIAADDQLAPYRELIQAALIGGKVPVSAEALESAMQVYSAHPANPDT